MDEEWGKAASSSAAGNSYLVTSVPKPTEIKSTSEISLVTSPRVQQIEIPLSEDKNNEQLKRYLEKLLFRQGSYQDKATFKD